MGRLALCLFIHLYLPGVQFTLVYTTSLYHTPNFLHLSLWLSISTPSSLDLVPMYDRRRRRRISASWPTAKDWTLRSQIPSYRKMAFTYAIRPTGSSLIVFVTALAISKTSQTLTAKDKDRIINASTSRSGTLVA